MKPATTSKTALLIIDVQRGFDHSTHWGTSRSTPECESNIALLLNAARAYNKEQQQLATTTASSSPDGAAATSEIAICHVHHHSIYPTSLLHPSTQLSVGGGASVRAVEPQPFAAPQPGEAVFVKNVNSGFIGTGLEAFLRGQDVRQLVIVGLTTDHCVSTTTRMASNLRVVAVRRRDDDGDGDVYDEGDVVLVGDACATYAKGGFDAETVHQVSLASLDGEFAQVESTRKVLEGVLGQSG